MVTGFRQLPPQGLGLGLEDQSILLELPLQGGGLLQLLLEGLHLGLQGLTAGGGLRDNVVPLGLQLLGDGLLLPAGLLHLLLEDSSLCHGVVPLGPQLL